MMTGSVNGAVLQGANNNMQAGHFGMNAQTDSVSRNIRKQMANAQKQLQELSSNQDMTLEEKMQKRQEIQQEITNLNQQLRQHQIEMRREQQSKSSSMEDMLGGSKRADAAKSGSKGIGLSQAGMQAMISADSSIKLSQVQGSVAARMEGRAGVLKAEIKQDGARGKSTETKKKELAEAEQKAMNATASQLNTLADAIQTMEEAAKAEQDSKEGKADARAERKDSEKDKTVNTDKEGKNGRETGEVSGDTAGSAGAYTSVDIRL